MPLVTLALWFLAIATAIGLWHDGPVIDDWTYAWTVEHLLDTGRLSVLDWSSAYPVFQAVWGAAWSALLGFSFTTLSLSTLVLGAVGCGALYLLLRELGASTQIALVGALCLAVNPLFVFLSTSFMTDVPFITFSTLALLCYVRAATRGEARYVWWAGLWSFAAFLTRQVGIVIPVAGLPLLLMPGFGAATAAVGDRWPLRRSYVVVSLITTWVAMAITLMALRDQLGVTSIMQRWASNVYAGPAEYHLLGPYFLALISFYLLPALLAHPGVRGVWRRPRLLGGIAISAALLLFLVHGGIPVPLRHDQTWSLSELGSSRALINGELSEVALIWLDVPARAAGLLALTLLLVVIAGHGWRQAPHPNPLPAPTSALRAAAGRRGERGLIARWIRAPERFWPRAPIVTFIVTYLVLVVLLWMYNDRYYLVLVPPLVALILGGHGARPAPQALPAPPALPQRGCRAGDPAGRLRLATCALVMFALIALVGTRDAQRFNQAVRDASQALLDAGVPPSDIDAGYAWNGWMLYAHPANLAPGMAAWRDVPWVTSLRKARYLISKAPDVEGYRIARTVSWRGLPWPGPDRLFVLEQERGADTSVSAEAPDTR